MYACLIAYVYFLFDYIINRVCTTARNESNIICSLLSKVSSFQLFLRFSQQNKVIRWIHLNRSSLTKTPVCSRMCEMILPSNCSERHITDTSNSASSNIVQVFSLFCYFFGLFSSYLSGFFSLVGTFSCKKKKQYLAVRIRCLAQGNNMSRLFTWSYCK